MRRLDESTAEEPVRLVQFARAFYLGGTEGQLIELLRGLPPRYQLRVSALEARGPLLQGLQSLGFTPRTFPLAGSFLSPRTVEQILRLARWLRRERTQLVHAHDFYATLLAVPAARLARVKVVVSRLDLAHWHGAARRAALAVLTRMADHVVANAQAIREQLITQERLPSRRVSVIHNGLDLPRFDVRMAGPLQAPLPETGGAPVLVHVANMNHPVKRQEDLLRALALLPAAPPLQAWLVGDGPRRVSLEQLSWELGLSDRVHFLGHRQDVPALLARADLGVLCSSAEGLSNAVIEGMAARLPMVVTRVGGNPELVAHLRTGWVVEPGDPEGLAHALRMLLQSEGLRRRFGEAAREHVAQHLSLSRMVEAHDRLYQGLLV